VSQIAVWDLANAQIVSASEQYVRAVSVVGDKSVVILGAGGFFGRWASLVCSNLQTLNPKSLGEVIAITSYGSLESTFGNYTDPARRVQWLEPAGLKSREALKNADLVLDFRLPSTSSNVLRQALQFLQFQTNLLGVARRIKPGATIVIPSSGAVYGTRRNLPSGLREVDSQNASNLTTYGASKRFSELLAKAPLSKKKILMPRIFSSLGPMIRYDSPLIMNTFLKQANLDNKVICTAGEEVYRDFASPIDIVLQILALAGSTPNSFTAINVGSTNVMSVQMFASEVCNLTSSELEINQSPADSQDYYFPDLSQMNRALGNPMTIPFDQTLELTQKFWVAKT
jgi:nucleoside-diphosphate-sugar epimerase